MICVRLLVSIAATIAVLFAPVNSAVAFRCHRHQCCSTNYSSPDCCRPCYGTNYICAQYKLEENLYYAHYLEDGCGAVPWPIAIEAGELEDLPHDCPGECFLAKNISAKKSNASDGSPTLFQGFPAPLTSDYSPRWADGITECDMFYKCIHVWQNCRTYKAKVYELKLPNGKHFYMAYQIDAFPSGTCPRPLPILLGNKCVGGHTYSFKTCGGKPLVLLTN
jgi:hypothetical protein